MNLRARHTVYNTPTLAMFSGPHGADKPAAILSVPFIANYLQNLRNRIQHHTPPMQRSNAACAAAGGRPQRIARAGALPVLAGIAGPRRIEDHPHPTAGGAKRPDRAGAGAPRSRPAVAPRSGAAQLAPRPPTRGCARPAARPPPRRHTQGPSLEPLRACPQRSSAPCCGLPLPPLTPPSPSRRQKFQFPAAIFKKKSRAPSARSQTKRVEEKRAPFILDTKNNDNQKNRPPL